MARVNVFLQDELLEAIDSEAESSRMNRSALIQKALADFLELRRQVRERERLQRQREKASRDIDRLAAELGDWDPVKIIREFRDSRSRGIREPRRPYRSGPRRKRSR